MKGKTMLPEMIVTTTEHLPNCVLCGKKTHDTHIEYVCEGTVLFMHLKCAARMSGTLIRHINRFYENLKGKN